jgi:hypothetical protein
MFHAGFSWYATRRGPVGRRGGKDEQRRQMVHSSNFKKVAGDRQTAYLGRSAFRLTRGGRVFEGVGTYVVVMRGQKSAKGWLPASGLVWKLRRRIVLSVRNVAIRPGGSKNRSALWGVIASTERLGVLSPFPKDLMEQARTDRLASVDRYNCASPFLMTQEMVAAFDTQNAEAGLLERADEIGSGDPRNPAHAAMVTRWMPMNSDSCSGAPSTSRHSSIASRIRSVTSSSERACVWQPAMWGTEAT